MIFKVITLFFVFMAVLAMFGRLRFPKLPDSVTRRLGRTCPDCGRPQIGKGPCPCRERRA
ncbi:hypothetical protein [Pseudoroseicyclus tamaricis]|uniref:Uncharacterized protein n=1 Tax=Pseudoroseicyclus tamaricis TaxID=2705421 RepID=A0A6B2JW22_9RHOB|nr:hypothetical protein [Pseudoroseicyclus tamaricis]NDV02310.1 hypothetical protein [Pseudoroseicyclus tamaricis]